MSNGPASPTISSLIQLSGMERVINIADQVRLIIQPWLTKIIEQLTSQKNQRIALNSLVFGGILGVMATLAISIYSLFYTLYMPQASIVIPFYLQYPTVLNSDMHPLRIPFALINLTEFKPAHTPFLVPTQHYSFSVDLTIPDSNENLKLGNFMVSVQLFSKNLTLGFSSRPGIVQYKSLLQRSMALIWNFPSIFISVPLETQKISIKLIESYAEKRATPLDRVSILLSEPKLQTYGTNLRVDTHFQGLSYFMYHWWLVTSIAFISFIIFIETMILSSFWKIIEVLFINDDEDETQSDEYENTTGNTGVFKTEQNLEETDKNILVSNRTTYDDKKDDADYLDGGSNTRREFKGYDTRDQPSAQYKTHDSRLVYRRVQTNESLEPATQLNTDDPYFISNGVTTRTTSSLANSRYGSLYSLPYESAFSSQYTTPIRSFTPGESTYTHTAMSRSSPRGRVNHLSTTRTSSQLETTRDQMDLHSTRRTVENTASQYSSNAECTLEPIGLQQQVVPNENVDQDNLTRLTNQSMVEPVKNLENQNKYE
ncbi:hypothetical protein BDV3_006737 [Batrachochytrium dendrobatidis]|uniref:Seipin n=2 Tax=Batrachochytrium dendrobatidis (strain JEL423) TaxID=403673 RepID=A0A177WSI7_BATDL|nr:hypothetical protein BDEG_26058 [Batrachochytrium dendrobatidis JEL423]